MKSDTPQQQPNNPLHGITLETILIHLVDHFGWEELSYKVSINCFKTNPSLKSSLKFLRRTPWAREKVEYLYLWLIKQ
ncbi:MAG: VF530 family protein [Bacteroidota bacterium]